MLVSAALATAQRIIQEFNRPVDPFANRKDKSFNETICRLLVRPSTPFDLFTSSPPVSLSSPFVD